MLGAPCPRCGAPCSVSLATPDYISCGHCNYSGAPPAAARQEIHGAIAVLRGMSTRRRQLGGLQRRSVTRSWLYTALFLFVLCVVVAPFALFALVVSLGPGPDNPWFTAMLGFGPLLLVLLSGVVGVWWLRRSRRKLLESCAASPPSAPGEPARCHVCGAPLAPGGAEPVVRCGYCQADNIVTREAMARVAGHQALLTTGLENAVRRNASSFGMQTVLVNGLVIAMALAAPVGCFVAAVIVLMGLSQMELEADTTARYVRYPTVAGECLARVRTEDGKRILDFKGAPAPGMPARLSVPPGKSFTELGVTDLVGLEVVGPENRILKVKRVLRTEVDRSVNLLRMVDHEGQEQDVEAPGTCFPREPRIVQLAHREDLILSDVHDMASAGERLILATGDLEVLSKSGGKVRSVSTLHETEAVEAHGSSVFTLSRGDDDAESVNDLEERNAAGELLRYWERNTVHRSPFTSNDTDIYYARKCLYRLPWTGGTAEQVSDSGKILGTVADATGVYWIATEGQWGTEPSLYFRGNGTPARKLAAGVSATENPQLALAGSRLIWLGRDDQLLALGTNGGAPVALGKLEGARGIRADAKDIYVALMVDTRHQIARLPADATDTKGVSVVAPRAGKIEAMVLESDALYWVDGAYVMKLPRSG